MTKDAKLRQHIIDELEFDPAIVATHIGVAVGDGIVSLTGHVASFAGKKAVEAATQRVKGVRGMAEAITVIPREAHLTSDEELVRQALCMVEWDTTMPTAAIQITAEKGWLTLSGDVDGYFQSQSAEKAVQKLKGVVGVTNRINMRVDVSPRDLAARIKRVFERRDFQDARNIRVAVYGGKVTIEGSVRSMHERRLAERAAWGMAGVTFVENRLIVSDAPEGAAADKLMDADTL